MKIWVQKLMKHLKYSCLLRILLAIDINIVEERREAGDRSNTDWLIETNLEVREVLDSETELEWLDTGAGDTDAHITSGIIFQQRTQQLLVDISSWLIVNVGQFPAIIVEVVSQREDDWSMICLSCLNILFVVKDCK